MARDMVSVMVMTRSFIVLMIFIVIAMMNFTVLAIVIFTVMVKSMDELTNRSHCDKCPPEPQWD